MPLVTHRSILAPHRRGRHLVCLVVLALAAAGVLPQHAEAALQKGCGTHRLSGKTAARYLDVKAVLPGFRRVDPKEYGFPASAVKKLHGQPVIFRSDEPSQLLIELVAIVSGKAKTAKYRAEYADGAKARSTALQQLKQSAVQLGTSPDEIEASFQFGGVPVGDPDHGWLAHASANGPDGPRSLDFLLFFQEKGCDAAVGVLTSLSAPDSAGVIPLVTVGQEVSRRIAD
jgi:hypothetical protein